jgi:hypothetical protein
MVYALVVMYQIVSGLLAIRRRWRHWKARKGGAKYHKVATKPPSRNWMFTYEIGYSSQAK